MTCRAFKKEDDVQIKVSVKYLEDMLKLGKAMRCPQCKVRSLFFGFTNVYLKKNEFSIDDCHRKKWM